MEGRNSRGQISILIAILFQVLFVFFAMVINVGVLVHDKINLQNSTDIAAYYGAMKQAEIFNAMAHVNYQIRQAWKLMAWRLWTLADAGRNRDFDSYSTNQGGRRPPLSDGPPTYVNSSFTGPLVCLQNPFWFENNWEIRNNRPVSRRTSLQNLCKNSNINYRLPVIPSFGLDRLPIVGQILGPLFRFSRESANRITGQCDRAGYDNYVMAFKILASYKNAVRDRRAAMRRLQNLFLASRRADDFTDLFGNSVRATVEKTFRNNLTSTNAPGVEFEFSHSLTQPFLTPIEVRAFVKYMDLRGGTGTCDGQPQDIIIKPRDTPATNQIVQAATFYAATDYSNAQPTSAQAFALETTSGNTPIKSLVGFEKNPWILAYVHVRAKSKPRMIFSPLGSGTVELLAESYAMPFGGRVGPWYGKTWGPGDGQSSGQGTADRVDPLLPIRMGSGIPSLNGNHPNYSRFPGDRYGASSRISRSAGLFAVHSRRGPNDRDMPKHMIDDYGLLLESDGDPKEDLIVYNSSGRQNYPVRMAEIAAISPDLFDAAYYSIHPEFNRWIEDRGGPQASFVTQNVCNEKCFDFGTNRQAIQSRTFFTVRNQILFNFRGAGNPTIPADAYWFIRNPENIHTSWSEGLANPGTYNTFEGIGEESAKGGRSGYSVKIVSRRFLTKGNLPLGGGSVTGSIRNPPQ
ncbi:MAG: Tad domain-containing protein [Oligoflexia bacterium]|nr:Tad domain-containing protein [Oligoflexia bacterium]